MCIIKTVEISTPKISNETETSEWVSVFEKQWGHEIFKRLGILFYHKPSKFRFLTRNISHVSKIQNHHLSKPCKIWGLNETAFLVDDMEKNWPTIHPADPFFFTTQQLSLQACATKSWHCRVARVDGRNPANHLTCMKPYKSWDIYGYLPYYLVQDFSHQ